MFRKHSHRLLARLAALPIIREPEVRPALWLFQPERDAERLRAISVEQKLVIICKKLEDW